MRSASTRGSVWHRWCVPLPCCGHVRKLVANAIVGIRYDGSQVQGGSAAATEMPCYCTAVEIERLEAQGHDVRSRASVPEGNQGPHGRK
jgi:hypothetical protein